MKRKVKEEQSDSDTSPKKSRSPITSTFFIKRENENEEVVSSACSVISQNALNYIPPEVLIHIFSKLSISELLSAQRTCKRWREIIMQNYLWKQIALQEFGSMVLDRGSSDIPPTFWWSFVSKRRISRARFKHVELSPWNLIQEKYAYSPWRLLLAISLIQRTRGGEATLNIIEKFFELCPNPTAAAQADLAMLFTLLQPLGLQSFRVKVIQTLSAQFIHKDWKEPQELYGVGRLGNDSYKIFCLGVRNIKPQDELLKSYLKWLKFKSNKVEQESTEITQITV